MASGISYASAGFTVGGGAPYSGTNSQLSAAIQTIWSKEILFQAMPVLRFEQFAVKKTELGVQPGLTINFMRYNNLGDASQLVEGTRMETRALSASQFSITVAEHGYAVAVSELLLNASFDDVMASASRLLGRNMALYLDKSARDTIALGTSVIYGYNPPASTTGAFGQYNDGTAGTTRASLTGTFYLSPGVVKDAVETLSTKNVPRLGETYVALIHPHQSRWLRNFPEFIEVTQCRRVTNGAGTGYTTDTGDTGNGNRDRYTAYFLGDNAFGHAISLPVELRDGGVLDFGREHALAWYAIWGFGKITDESIVLAETN
jgi:N4-gp56 family major capsid protein